MTYFLAPSLVQLRAEVNAAFPKRDKSSDGWIGDPSHAARASGHNPCWTCGGDLNGIVRAIDIDVDDGDPGRDLRRMLLNELIGDPRIWYVISNGIIYSRSYGWQARTYTGKNGHFSHLHGEILSTHTAAYDTSKWFGPDTPKNTAPAVSLSNVRDFFTSGDLAYSLHVHRIEKALAERIGARIDVDGFVKRETKFAYRGWQQRVKSPDTSSIPTGYDLRLLGAGGRFRVVP